MAGGFLGGGRQKRVDQETVRFSLRRHQVRVSLETALAAVQRASASEEHPPTRDYCDGPRFLKDNVVSATRPATCIFL